MEYNEYTICKVAKLATEYRAYNCVKFNQKTYELLQPTIQPRHLLNDLQHVPDFRIEERNDFLFLVVRVFHSVDANAKRTERGFNCAQRLIHLFFEVPNAHDESPIEESLDQSDESMDDDALDSDEHCFTKPAHSHNGEAGDEASGSRISIDELYARLREAHNKHDIFVGNDNVQHASLLPTLTAYQRNTVRWMLRREIAIQRFPSEYIQMHCRWPVNDVALPDFYYHPRKAHITNEWIPFIDIPTGGILAEEMGLGKTVETLALILCNKRRMPSTRTFQVTDSDSEDGEPSNKRAKFSDSQFKCVCSRPELKDITKMIACTQCRRMQHRACVLQHVNRMHRIEDHYICPECWPLQPPVPSAATFIVSPVSIKMQWKDEIERHIADNQLKVLVYRGISKGGYISPRDMADYDVVLTDYNIMASEIYYAHSNESDRRLRKPPVFMKIKSPLAMVEWWRVCLDEAQMVESGTTNAARMVKLLPAVHRWAVTGTPLEKSIHDLYGLLFFMNCDPYDDRKVWNQIAQKFVDGNAEPIVDVLCKVMWRTCKTPEILAQTRIPPQTEIVHYVTMTDLERHFYEEQHLMCQESFLLNARRLAADDNVAKMNPKILNSIMEPLRKLRQDCSVPSVFHKNANRAIVKRSLKPQDLYKHLLGNAENDCKSELRSIASSLNGLAALSIIKNDYETASNQYKGVLRWAKDYTGNICVDSLLQIHAMHNLLLMRTEMALSAELISEYQANLEKLERKYIQTNADIVRNCHLKQVEYEREIGELEKRFLAPRAEYVWWSDLLNDDHDERQDQLVHKIISDIKDQYKTKDIEFTTARGLTIIIVKWLDEVASERKNVQRFFGKLDKFRNNIVPLSNMNESVRSDVERLINSAFACHLDLNNASNSNSANKRKPRVECLLCKAKFVLETYECVIFDKKFVQTVDQDAVRGSWKPAYQEYILKLLHAAIKQRNAEKFKENIADGKTHLKLLDALKNEYKEYSQLWVEINYTVSTFDEMNMCKSRLRVVDPAELERTNQRKTNMDVFAYEVDESITDLNRQLKAAELRFVRKLGSLKYLKHLEENKEQEDCPICTSKPESKYAVFECGHHMCMICSVQMIKQNPINIKCVVCRHAQRVQNLYYVNLQKGNYRTDASSKIEEIVETVFNLREQDPSVKIIIFSHWSNILSDIGEALRLNKISHRSQMHTFHLTVQQFKDADLGVTCLLLPLRYGSKGLNLIEAKHVFLVEPILNPSEELQAVGRVHRIGQTKPTFVHRFIVRNTIEETIHTTIASDVTGKWKRNQITVENLRDLFILENHDEAEYEE